MAQQNQESIAAANSNWDIPATDRVTDDPLLGCLLFIAKTYNQPVSAHAATAGLPLVDNRLTPELFLRASERASLSSHICKKSLFDIHDQTLPAVLLLKDQRACVLLEWLDGGLARIMLPESGIGETTVTVDDLAEEYYDHCIFSKPKFRFSERSHETLKDSNNKHWFWSVIKQAWPTYSEVLIASFLINVFALASPLFIMNVYDRVVPNHALETLWVLAFGVGIVFTFEFVMKTLRGYFVDIAGKSVDIKLSAKIFEHMMGIKMANRPRSVGAFANTVHSFESFREFITSTTITVLIDLPFVVIYLAVIYLLGSTLVLIPAATIPLVIIVGVLLQLPLIELTKESYKHAAEKQATLIESLTGAEAIKCIGAESALQARWENVVKTSSKIGLKLRMFSNLGINLTQTAQQMASVFIVIAGVYQISEGHMTTGALIACTILTGRALAPMAQVASLLTRYYQSVNSLHSLDKVMQLPTDREQQHSFLHRPTFVGRIELKDVGFSYPEEQVPALKNISLKIDAGERIGIIGRIGSGKTTLAKLIAGLYNPAQGSILVDGTDIQQVDPSDLRQNMGYVSQDIMLFYGSVKDNICFGAPHTEDLHILRAAKVAGVDLFTNRHPKGFDMQVGERGQQLSGGQRQSIAIARALLLDPNILVMDEPTNSMDDSTEAYFRLQLSHFIAGKTFILITHKASMLSLVDRLIVIDDGMIIADGPKNDVIAQLSAGKLTSKPTREANKHE